MQDSSVNHLSLEQPFVSRDAHLLWKLMTKGERSRQRYDNWRFGHGQWTKRQQHRVNKKDQILGQREADK